MREIIITESQNQEFKDALNRVSEVFEITPDRILMKCRHKEIVLAKRALIMMLIERGFINSTIGKLMSMNRTMAIHHRQQFDEQTRLMELGFLPQIEKHYYLKTLQCLKQRKKTEAEIRYIANNYVW